MVKEKMKQLRVIGQETVWSQLVSIYKRDKIGNAYLFHGPEGVGKEAMAIKFASLLNCCQADEEPCLRCQSCMKFNSLQHSNLTIICPFPIEKKISKDDSPIKALSPKTVDLLSQLILKKGNDPYFKLKLPRSNSILINSIREIRKKVYLKNVELGRKMILIFEADKLMAQQGQSGNALLKILEEPPDFTTFVLCTEKPQRLTETIHSRCQKIFFPPILDSQIESFLKSELKISEHEALIIARLSQGNMMIARQLANSDIADINGIVQSMVSWIASKNENGWRKFLSHVSINYRANPSDLIFQFKLLSFWFRDALHDHNSSANSKYIMSIMGDQIKEFNNMFPNADHTKIIVAIEKFANSLKQNFQLNLVVMNLLIEIRDGLGNSA